MSDTAHFATVEDKNRKKSVSQSQYLQGKKKKPDKKIKN